MTIGDWDKELAETPVDELIKRKQALEALRAWPTFDREFKWTRIFVLISSIEYEIERRKTR